MFPGIVFAIFFVLNALVWWEKSSGVVPFGTMFALVLLWFVISVPLMFAGSYIGNKTPTLEDPVKTNKIPRQIPQQAWYMQPLFSMLIYGGILPFDAVLIALLFVLTSMWLIQFYYILASLLHLHHPCCDVCRNNNCALLRPAVPWRLLLVMEGVIWLQVLYKVRDN